MSKKNTSRAVSGLGFGSSFFIALFKAVEKLGGSEEDVYEALKDGSSLVDDFAALVVKNAKKFHNFPIFLSIQLGTHSSINSLRASLSNCGHSIGDWANNILDKITLASTPTTLNLVVVSNADLGFSKGATFAETCAKAKEFGLDLCPAEVGPQLRIQYKNQPRGEWLIVAMEPITDSDGDLSVFDVKRDDDGRSWLDAHDGHPSNFWNADNRFVFVSRRFLHFSLDKNQESFL